MVTMFAGRESFLIPFWLWVEFPLIVFEKSSSGLKKWVIRNFTEAVRSNPFMAGFDSDACPCFGEPDERHLLAG